MEKKEYKKPITGRLSFIEELLAAASPYTFDMRGDAKDGVTAGSRRGCYFDDEEEE